MEPTASAASASPVTIGVPRTRALAWLAPLLDTVTGLDQLEAVYRARPAPAAPPDFIRYTLRALQIRNEIRAGSIDDIPAQGPLLLIANHPYGAAEGLALAELALRRRGDVRLLANGLLQALPELAPLVIAVDVFRSGVNAASLRVALRHLKDGGALIMFPAGEVSRIDWRNRQIADPPWSTSVAALARRSGAAVQPVFIEGQPRWRSLAAGSVASRLRTAMLARDFLALRGRTLGLRIGVPLPASDLARIPEPTQTDYLRVLTYSLGTDRCEARPARVLEPLAVPVQPAALQAEIDALAAQRLLEVDDFALYLAPAARIPQLLAEIGRLRELSFRLLQEGSGLARDLDAFDAHYEHLFLWHRTRREIVGAYRLGFVDRILPQQDVAGLYTRTLFRFDAGLFAHTGPAIELGRSFVHPDWQKSFQPLRLLWAGIAAVLAREPQIRYLFGPVSISPCYSLAARRLIASALSRHHADAHLQTLISPLHPLAAPREAAAHRHVVSALADTRLLSRVIARLERGRGLPVLMRHYLELNGRFAGFNVDDSFGGTLDGLVFVDIARIPPRTLQHFLKAAAASHAMPDPD